MKMGAVILFAILTVFASADPVTMVDYWRDRDDPPGLSVAEQFQKVKQKQMAGESLDTEERAIIINGTKLGGKTAEIGAGPVTYWVLDEVGRVSQSFIGQDSRLAKASSNRIHGSPEGGYVNRQRLAQQLNLLIQEIRELYFDPQKPDSDFDPAVTRFYALATTVRRIEGDGHAWVGIRFQAVPGGSFQELTFHLRLLGRDFNQKMLIGQFAIDLIYSVFHCDGDWKKLLELLGENTVFGHQKQAFSRRAERGAYVPIFEVDSANFVGDYFPDWSDPKVAMEMVRMGFSRAITLDPDGKITPASSLAYKKAPIIHQIKDSTLTAGEWSEIRQASARLLELPEDQLLPANLITLNNIRRAETDEREAKNLTGIMLKTGQPLIITKDREWIKLDDIARTLNLAGGLGLVVDDHVQLGLGPDSISYDMPGRFTLAVKKIPSVCAQTLGQTPLKR